MKIIFITGILFFIGSLFLIKNSLEQLNVWRNGYLVKMRIEQMPSSCIGSKVTYHVKLSYNNQIYDKQTRGNFCKKYRVGELIEMRIIENVKSVLFPNETGLFNLLSCIAVGVFGIVISFASWKKINS